MTAHRAKAQDLCMASAMPFQQHWEYRTTWPIADLVHDEFFIDLRHMLRPGDSITICRFDSTDERKKKMLEVGTVRVLASQPLEKSVPLVLVGEVFHIAKAEELLPIEIVRGQSGKHNLKRGGEIIAEYGSKTEAEAALAKMAA